MSPEECLHDHRPGYEMLNNQQGLALATAMIFLVILSIIGITAMRNAATEQKTSSNIRDQNHAFQLAETVLVRVMRDAQNNNLQYALPSSILSQRVLDTIYDTNPLLFQYTSYATDNPGQSLILNASLTYRGESASKGQTLQQINSLNATSLHNFQIETTGKYSNSVATLAQGITLVGPKIQ